jgi:pSer/pThr/pTyr-binding forkhead associated (FHA) protein
MSTEGRKPVYWLVGVEGKARRVRLPINTPLLVGRGASNHVVLDDPRISRQHARFAPQHDGAYLYDLNSANGTIVNGVGVTKHKLAPDDVIRFGRYSFRMEVIDEPVAEPDLETPTLIATESVARMLVGRESAGSGERPMVDLTQLQDAHQKLGTLYSFMKAISSTIDRSELLRLIGAKIREVYPHSRAVAIYVRTGKGPQPVYPQIPPSIDGYMTPPPPAPPFQLAHFTGTGILSAEEPTLPDRVIEKILDSTTAILAGESNESSRVPVGRTCTPR